MSKIAFVELAVGAVLFAFALWRVVARHDNATRPLHYEGLRKFLGRQAPPVERECDRTNLDQRSSAQPENQVAASPAAVKRDWYIPGRGVATR